MTGGRRGWFASFVCGVTVAASACRHTPLSAPQAGAAAGATPTIDETGDGDASTGGRAGTGPTGGVAGSGGSEAPADLAPPPPAGFAVVNSDFASTSISLLTPTGDLATSVCVHTTLVNGSPTISGDVVLPSQPQRGGELVLVDRGNRALSFVDPKACQIVRQIFTGGGTQGTTPRDVVIVGEGRAYVTRFAATGSSEPSPAGDDVLILDPRTGARLGRIDLAPYAGGGTGTPIHAQPDRALIAAGRVVVSLSDSATDGSVYGEGRIVLIDPRSDAVVQALSLVGLKQCGDMAYLPDQKLLFLVCGGPSQGHAAGESGVAVVDMSGSVAALARTISAVGFYDYPAKAQGIAATASGGMRRAFVNALGIAAPGSVPDEALAVDLDGADPIWFANSKAFDLGPPALAGTTLLLPDATQSAPRIRVFDVSTVPHEIGSFATDAANALAPRQVAAY